MNLAQRWRAFDPAWRYAISVYMIGRIILTVWSFGVVAIAPLTVYNLVYKDTPIVAVFDVRTSERYVYARQIGETLLTFRAGEPGMLRELETASVWTWRDGRSQGSEVPSQALRELPELREKIFPYLDVAPTPNFLLAFWQRFDTNWYLAIAQYGYGAHSGDTLYPPLYPALIRVLGGLFGGSYLWVAWFIANAALVASLGVFYRLVVEWQSPAIAVRSLVYLALFPTGFFLFAAYTESLYLLLTLLMFRALARENLESAGAWACLGILTRLQGIALLVPIGLAWFRIPPRLRLVKLHLFALPLLAIGIFLGMRALVVPTSILPTNDPGWQVRFALPWENYWNGLEILRSGQFQVSDVLNMLIATLFAIILGIGWRDLLPAYRLYSVATWLIIMTHWVDGQALGSMARYVLTLFPCFILLAKWGENAWVNRVIVYSSVLMQLFLSAQFVLWGWVG